jgi:hypothetical protein
MAQRLEVNYTCDHCGKKEKGRDVVPGEDPLPPSWFAVSDPREWVFPRLEDGMVGLGRLDHPRWARGFHFERNANRIDLCGECGAFYKETVELAIRAWKSCVTERLRSRTDRDRRERERKVVLDG